MAADWEQEDFERAIADVRGRQRKRPDPARIADVVSRLMARRGYAQMRAGLEWQTAWREVAGEPLARNSRPGRLSRGVLEIVAGNSSVLQELTFRKRELLKKFKTVIDDQTIRDLKLRVGDLG